MQKHVVDVLVDEVACSATTTRSVFLETSNYKGIQIVITSSHFFVWGWGRDDHIHQYVNYLWSLCHEHMPRTQVKSSFKIIINEIY